MIILDSNIWIAYFNFDDNQHQRSTEVVSGISEELGISEYIISEVCTVLTQKLDKKATNKFLDFVFNNSDIRVIYSKESCFHSTLKLYRVLENQKLSFVDASLLYHAKDNKIITFDKELQKEIDRAKKLT